MENDFALSNGTIVQGSKNSYRILSCIRRDGMGFTYIGEPVKRQLTTPAKVVLREHFMPHCSLRGDDGVTVVTPPEISSTVATCMKGFEKASMDRARISASSPSIINVLDIFETNGTFYYVVEFLDGITFEEYVNRKGPLSWDETREILSPILDAVKKMHTYRAIHTEITPSHIRFVNHHGQSIPVLFSLYATLHFNDEGKQNWTLPVMTCRTGYAPPEQYRSIDHFMPQTDVYALASTIVFSLSGKHLPDSRVLTEEIVRETLPPALPETTVKALVHALNPDPSLRTSSVTSLRDELREFYGGKQRTTEDDTEGESSLWKELYYGSRVPLIILAFAVVAATIIMLM